MALEYFGSFQIGDKRVSESPLEEVWDDIGRFATMEYLRAAYEKPDTPNPNWEKHLAYARVRAHQAIEFRRMLSSATLLAGPLPLYYSFLNLMRSLIAVVPEKIPSKGHGLKYISASNLLANAARSCSGTFLDYLEVVGRRDIHPFSMSLGDCIAQIPELTQDFFFPGKRTPTAIPVYVRAKSNGGAIRLEFNKFFVNEAEFRKGWTSWFPVLKDICKLADEGQVLTVVDAKKYDTYKKVSQFCYKHFEPQLILSDIPIWYAIRITEGHPVLPRPARYLVALFILSSIVRYQPEAIVEVRMANSEVGWLLERFVRKAERFFPQMMLRWGQQNDLYF